MIDILTDLKQAVSRQRNKENINYGSYIYIYNQNIFSKSKDELLSELNSVYLKLQDAVELYKIAKDTNRESGFMMDSDFKAYSILKDGFYEINDQAFKADKYFILEIREQYQKGFDVKGTLENAVEVEPIELPNNISYSTLVDYFKENSKSGVIDWGLHSTRLE